MDGTEVFTFYLRIPEGVTSLPVVATIVTDEPYPGWAYGSFTLDIPVVNRPPPTGVGVALQQVGYVVTS